MTVRANSFDLLRLLAALAVVGGHAFDLTGHTQGDPLVRFTGIGGLGSLGVSVFFAISGFLVTASFVRRPNVAVFAAARGLRILPALAAVVILSALVLGPLVSRLPAGAYFASPQTWIYPVRNLLILPVDYRLPGVFAANPYPDAVNGSLWTLRLEVGFYAVTAFLGWRRWLGQKVLGAIAVALALLLFGAMFLHAPLPAVLLFRSGLLYFVGAAVFVNVGEQGVQVRKAAWPIASYALITLVAVTNRRWGDALLALNLPLPLLALAVRGWPWQQVLARIGDLSYGVYLWSFPVQQTLVQLQPGIGVAPLFGETLLVVLPLAWLSWRLVERPALALKPRLHRLFARFDQAPAPQIEAPDGREREATGPISGG